MSHVPNQDLVRERPGRRRAVTVAVAAAVLGITVTAPVVARTGDNLREGVRNGTATKETRVISGVTGEQYGTRQSNVSIGSSAGGAAIYGCRRPAKECTRHVNLSTGPAAAFVTAGTVPFSVSGGGLVERLNADKLDGLDATQIVDTAQAGKAASARTVDTFTPAGKLALSAATASNADPAAARAAATEVLLLQVEPFTVYGKCFVDTTANTVNAEVLARTSQNGAVLDGQADNLTGQVAYLDTTTAEDARQVDTVFAPAAAVEVEFDDDETVLMAPDGSLVEFRVQAVAKHGTPPAGDGPYGSGDRCGFAVTRLS